MKKIIITESQLKRLIDEQIEQPQQNNEYQQLDKVLAQAGIALTPEEKMELSPECPMEEPPAQYAGLINQIKSKIETMDLSSLVKTLSQVKSLIGKKPQPVQEQLAPVIIAGITVPGVAIAIVAGFIALIIIVKIAKLISRGGRRSSPACKRRRKLVRRFGIDGNFM
jgi:hypothetical protein